MATELLLRGAFVVPKRATDLGFTFKFPTAEAALADLLEGPVLMQRKSDSATDKHG
jgi:NAD dependent epimerase/dehydratase family enzyme